MNERQAAERGFSLLGKTVLVTGASSGLGRACAVACSGLGARLVLSGRDQQRLEQTRSLLQGGDHLIFAGDLTCADNRAALVAQAPLLDGAVFAAGVHRLKPAKFVTAAAVEETFAINYTAPVALTTALLKAAKVARHASLVFVGSVAADSASVGNSLYAGSKGALLSTARVFALELARQGIRVNVISPGQVQTAMVEQNARQMTAEALAQNEAAYPLGVGQPEDVANAALFLLSGLSAWMTGHNLVVDGGYTLR